MSGGHIKNSSPLSFRYFPNLPIIQHINSSQIVRLTQEIPGDSDTTVTKDPFVIPRIVQGKEKGKPNIADRNIKVKCLSYH